MPNDIVIDLIINGLRQLDDLAKKLGGVQAAGQKVGNATSPLEKAERATLRYAQATARLQTAQGNLAGAQNTLASALSKVTNNSLAAIRAQTQLAQVTNRVEGRTQSLSGLFGQLTQKLVGLTPAGRSVSAIGSAATISTGAVAGLAAAAVGVYGAFKAVEAAGQFLFDLGEKGIEANRKIETLKLGLATVIASAGKITLDGVELKGVDALTASLPIAAEQFQKLRIEALQTAGTIETIGPAFQQAIGPGLAAGLGLDQIRKTTIDIVNLATSIGQPLDQVGQELRAIFEGQIDRNARIAKTLGITSEDLQNAREAGKLAEFLNEKLLAASAAGKLVAQTFEGAKSNLAEAADVFAGTVTEGLFNTLRDKLNEILPQVFDTKNANLLSDAFAGVGDTLTQIFNVAGDLIARTIDEIVLRVKQVSEFLNDNRETVAEIITGIGEIVRIVVGLIADIITGNSNTVTWKSTFEVIREVVKTIAVTMAYVRDIVGLIRNAAVLTGAAIANSILTPLAKGAQFIAQLLSFLPSIGGAAQIVADSLTALATAAQGAAANAFQGLTQGVRTFGDEATRTLNRIEDAGGAAAFGRTRATPTGRANVSGRQRTDTDDLKKKSASQLRALAGANEELAKAISEQTTDLLRNQLEAERQAVERSYAERTISIQDYYAKLRELSEKATALEIKNLEAQKAASQARIKDAGNDPKREAEVIKERAQIVKIETDIANAQAKGAREVVDLRNSEKDAVAALTKQYEDLNIELLKLQGDTQGAATLEIAARYRELLAQAIAEGDVLIQQKIQRAIEILNDQQRLALSETRVGTINTRLATELDKLQSLRDQGLIGEIEYRNKTLEIEQEKSKEILRQLMLQRLIISATLKPGAERDKALADIDSKIEDARQLGVDKTFGEIRRGIENDIRGSFRGLFSDILSGTRTIKESFHNFFGSILKSISDRLSEKITDTLFDKFVDPLLDRIFGNKQGKGNNQQQKSPIDRILDIFFGGEKADADGEGGFSGKFSKAFDGFFGKLKGVFTKVEGGFSSVFGGLFKGLSGILSKIGGGIGAAAGGIGSIIKTVASVVGSFFGLGGFAEGGFTGQGSKFEPAGVVHAGEYVFDAESVKRIGVANLDKLRKASTRGYAFGGFVQKSKFKSADTLYKDLQGRDKLEIKIADLKGDDVTREIFTEVSLIRKILQLIFEKDLDQSLFARIMRQFGPLLSGVLGGGGLKGGLLGSFLGFDEGGFTGFGGNLQPAGIVHANEFVFSAPSVANLGVGYLQNLHNLSKRGYADGGLVTPIAAPNFGSTAAGSGRQQVVLFALGDQQIDDVLDEYGSDNVLIKRVSRNRKTLKALLNS